MKERKETIMAIGVLPNPKIPVLFFDIDSKDIDVMRLLKEFIKRNCNIILSNKSYLQHRHFAIYSTFNGFHFIMKTASWEETKSLLLELKEIFPDSDYMSNDPKQFDDMLENITETMRIRISPKINKDTFEIISHEPIIFEKCYCYEDLRIGTKEVYEVK